jgi:16S rRNA (cytosine967-C5)-methyltransferase
MKLFPNLVQAVTEALSEIFETSQYADRVIERVLKSNPKWGARDRAFIAETVYDIVRRWRLLTSIYGKKPLSNEDYWQVFGIHLILNQRELPMWRNFAGLDTADILLKREAFQYERKIRESIPDWIDDLGTAELGEAWEPTLMALNHPAEVIIRANTIKVNPAELQKLLAAETVETQLLNANALRVIKRQNLFRTTAFKDGLFEVQDYSSQQVSPLLAPEEGMRVVDACAGGGGKTLHLAALMQNKGHLIGLDTEEWKLKNLRERASRAGASIIETRLIENPKTIKSLYNSADRLLLDVPCSGLGVLRRNPDAKWKLEPEFIERMRATQQDILQGYSNIVRPGGFIVYATCSILPSENTAQVAHFLNKANGKFSLISQKAILPQDEGYDGFFMALLRRES